ncbi:hypothetical protein T484DRAFT_2741704 [Baffinella frigidus]|nr:hypothetical protein T484DRAFT_2741704 [Cryptophyta sp. CCMP2293]
MVRLGSSSPASPASLLPAPHATFRRESSCEKEASTIRRKSSWDKESAAVRREQRREKSLAKESGLRRERSASNLAAPSTFRRERSWELAAPAVFRRESSWEKEASSLRGKCGFQGEMQWGPFTPSPKGWRERPSSLMSTAEAHFRRAPSASQLLSAPTTEHPTRSPTRRASAESIPRTTVGPKA